MPIKTQKKWSKRDKDFREYYIVTGYKIPGVEVEVTSTRYIGAAFGDKNGNIT